MGMQVLKKADSMRVLHFIIYSVRVGMPEVLLQGEPSESGTFGFPPDL